MQETPSRNGQRHAQIRRRLLCRGAEALADEEILELALTQVISGKNTPSLATTLLDEYGSLGHVITAPAKTLQSNPDLGELGAVSLKLMQAGALRLVQEEVLRGPLLFNWDRLLDYLNASLARERVEHFHVLYLDRCSRLLADEAQSRGTVDHALVYPREVVRRALELNATTLILVHNHPSGDPTPSQDDMKLTHQIAAAASLLSIELHDHIVVGNGRSVSFRRDGRLSGLLSGGRGALTALVPHLGRVSER